MRWDDGSSSSGATIDLGTSGEIEIHNTGNQAVIVTADLDGYFANSSGSGGSGFFPVDDRLYDSTAVGSSALGGGQTLSVTVADAAADLPDADAIVAAPVVVAVSNGTASGGIRVYASNAVPPSTTDLSYSANDDSSALALSPTGPDGKVDITNTGDAPVDITVDVAGYFTNGDPTPAPYFTEGSHAPNCAPDPILSTQFLAPDGQLSDTFVIGDGEVNTYDVGAGSDPVSLVYPPAGWQPASASDAELDLYDFPPRPSDSAGLAAWDDEYADFNGFLTNGLCTPQDSDNSSTPGIPGDPADVTSTPNWSGLSMYTRSHYNVIKGQLRVPEQSWCDSTAVYVEWVGVGDFQTHLEQAGLFGETYPTQGMEPFFEQLNSDTGYDWQVRYDYSAPIGETWSVSVYHNVAGGWTRYHFHSTQAGQDFGSTQIPGHQTWTGADLGLAMNERPTVHDNYVSLPDFGSNPMNDIEVEWGSDGVEEDPEQEGAGSISMRRDGSGLLLANVTSRDAASYTDTFHNCS
jgi:hypothetical protein